MTIRSAARAVTSDGTSVDRMQTRGPRAAGSRDSAFELARSLEVPVYDVLQTGYPNRMREWNSRQRKKS